MPSTYTSIVVPSGGIIRLPAVQPASIFKRLTVTANGTNAAPIFTPVTGSLIPGAAVTVTVEDTAAQHLSGTPGDGAGLQYN